jgi:dipeptidyl aminopeptidase/acylaminoacyl peptidase
MNRSTFAAAALTLLAATADAQAPKRPMTADDIMAIRALGSVALSPDARAVVYSVSAWEHPNARGDTAKGDKHDRRSHLWLVPASGGEPRQLTFGERGESAPTWSPDGRTIAFVTSRGSGAGEDGPRPQIWLLPADGGEARQLTQARDGVASYSWSPDGSKIAYLSMDSLPRAEEAKRRRRDDPQVVETGFRLSHIWVIDVATKQASEVVHGDFTVRGAPSWSPDGKRLTFAAAPTPMIRDLRGDVYIVDLATKQMDRIASAPHSPAAGLTSPAWSPDGATIAFTMLPQGKERPDGSMENVIGNDHLMLYDVASKRVRDARDPRFDYEINQLQWAPDGKRIIFAAGDRAYRSIFEYDIATSRYRKVAGGMLLSGLSFSKDGQTVAFGLETSSAPSDVHISDASLSAPRKLTTLNPEIADLALGETEVITWKSTDGTPVEGILLKPVGYQPGKRYPLIVEAHGGPTGAHSAGFRASSSSPGQLWAGQGWVVLYPNPRGSTNYGEKFMRGNILDWGGGDYRDIMTGVDHLIKAGIADSARMAFLGWSYGGYMTAWVVSQTARFKAARMGAGLSNLESMYGTTDVPGYIGGFFGGVPDKKTLALYRARSPITFVDRVTTPLLILHGGSDERVPTGQAMEYFRALKDRGRAVELVFYPRAGHGLTEYYHQLDKMRRELDWVTRYTLGASVTAAAHQ